MTLPPHIDGDRTPHRHVLAGPTVTIGHRVVLELVGLDLRDAPMTRHIDGFTGAGVHGSCHAVLETDGVPNDMMKSITYGSLI
jgi:hypothetical protein